MEENCYVEPIYKNMPSTVQLQNAQQLTLVVSGMGCPNCATRVHNKLVSLEGVYGVDVYLHMALAVVIFDRNKLSTSQLITAVSQAGNDGRHEYRAELIPVQ
jgi:copper chaperone CopZ